MNGACRPVVVDGKDFRKDRSADDTLLDDMATSAINELIIEKLSRPSSANSV